MWKQTLIFGFTITACIPAQPTPVYYGQPQPQPYQPQPQPDPYQPPPPPQPQPEPQPEPPPPPPDRPPPPPPPPWTFDARGWTLLGSETVDGRRDRDTIKVGKYNGRFDELTMVVYDSDLQLDEFVVTFANRESFAASVKHLFKENSRSRVIDLPGDDRAIKTIELKYSNLPGGGRARVELYGRDTGKPRPPKPDPKPPWTFDARGWTLLGSETVDGRRDRDTIKVGKYNGRFDELTMVVYDSDLQLDEFVVTFANRESFAASVKHLFKENSRSRVIDLPGDDRAIKTIELKYSNLPGGGRARVELYGRDTGKPRPPKPDPKPDSPPPDPTKFDPTGWTVIGRAVVDGKRDRELLVVGDGTAYKELLLRVPDGELELADVIITFGNKDVYSQGAKFVFSPSSPTARIDVPGKQRKIKSVELVYAGAPKGGKPASVEIYGRAPGTR
jgi:hypothetical protein